MESKKSPLGMVEEFHEAFNCPVYLQPIIPDIPVIEYGQVKTLFEKLVEEFKKVDSKSRSFLRMKLMIEELYETCEAMYKGDMVGIVDGLSDLRYVVYGTVHEFGLAPLAEKAFAEVHRSNMSKLGTDGKPIYRKDGKVLKGPNFTPPNLITIIQAHTDSY